MLDRGEPAVQLLARRARLRHRGLEGQRERIPGRLGPGLLEAGADQLHCGLRLRGRRTAQPGEEFIGRRFAHLDQPVAEQPLELLVVLRPARQRR